MVIKSMLAVAALAAVNLVNALQAPPMIPAPAIRTSSPPLPSPRPHYTRHDKHIKTCRVLPKGDGRDDAPSLLKAAKKCNHGGIVELPQGNNYTFSSPLDLTFLDKVDLVFSGTINFSTNTTYWQDVQYDLTYQNASTFWLIGGKDVNVYGGGVINGNGQPWYDLYAAQPLIKRPILLVVYGMYGGSVTDLTLVNAPQWNNLIINSTDVVYSDLFIHGGSTSSHVAKNTDGWDVYRSDNVWIKDSRIFNGDDCVSFKPNSTNIYVSNLYCNGSHGISVGSLGQYPGEYDLVQNIYSYNISMNYASDGARVKVWPGNSAAMSVDLQGGGGAGLVKNVTFDTFSLTSVDYAIELTQCYGQKNATLCVEFPSKMVLQDITFKNFNGTTSGNYKNVVTTIVCSQQDVCSNIVAENINVQCPSKYGTPKNICTRVDTTLLQYTCSAS